MMFGPLEAFFSALGLKLQVVVAGAVGAFISLRFFDGLGTRDRWITFVGGWGMASYLTGLAHEYFGLKSGSAETGIAILVGLFGMSIVAAVIKVIRETDWIGLVRRRSGGEGGS